MSAHNGRFACTGSAAMSIEDSDPAVQAEISRIEAMINSPQMRDLRRSMGGNAGIRPRNAATLVVVDGKPGDFRILMGKRHHSLKFMPGALVFPGGSVDRSDGSIPAIDELPEGTEQKIVCNMRGRPTKRAAHALGMAALREVSEESGILIGKKGAAKTTHPDWADFVKHGIEPSLSNMSLLSRAITPPGPPRRFDTWFFMCPASEIGHVPPSGFDPSGELEELTWIRPQDAIETDTREITRVMLVELMNRLERDPGMSPDYPVPFYFSVNNRFHKKWME